jgi:putative transcriptional regulator
VAFSGRLPVTSLQSHLLIATDNLAAPFDRAVVLLVRHQSDGALGLILNRRTTVLLRETWGKLSELPCRREAPIFLGGPCEGPLVALHTEKTLLDFEVLPGLYFSAAKSSLEALVAKSEQDLPQIKFFAGYSGWSAGQLESEIEQGSWSVLPAQLDHVFGADDELWKQASRYVADASWRTLLGVKQLPSDLRAN